MRKWIPVGLLLLAFALQVVGLDTQDIWGDEAFSIAISQSPLRDSLFMESNPPLYFLLLRGARALWGSSVFGLRFVSVVCTLQTVALVGRIAYTVAPRSHSYALLAAAMSPLLIYYAQEARMYGPLLVGSALSVLAFLQLLGGKRTAVWWLLYGIGSLVAIFSHYYAFSILLGEGLLSLIWLIRRREWAFFGRKLLVWAGMAALFMPFFLQHRLYWGEQTTLRMVEWSLPNLFQIGRRTFVALGAGTTISAEQQWLGWLVVLLACLGAVWQARRNGWAVGLLLVTVLSGVVFAWALTPLLPFFWERYLLGILPAFLALVGIGIASAEQWHPSASPALAAGIIAISIVPTWQYHTQPQYVKGGYGQAMRFIEARAAAEDVILLNGPLQASLFDYYRPKNVDGQIIDRAALLNSAESDAFFASAIADARRVWLVASGDPREYDPDGTAAAWLAQNGSFALHRDFPGVGIDLFVMQAPTKPQETLAVNLNAEILLTGYALESERLVAGEAIVLTLFWQAQQPIDAAYTVFTHLLNADGQLVAQADRQPQGGSRPTNSWEPGETIRDSYALVLPNDLPAGNYSIQIGMYLWPDLSRLVNMETGEDTTPIATVTVVR